MVIFEESYKLIKMMNLMKHRERFNYENALRDIFMIHKSTEIYYELGDFENTLVNDIYH